MTIKYFKLIFLIVKNLQKQDVIQIKFNNFYAAPHLKPETADRSVTQPN